MVVKVGIDIPSLANVDDVHAVRPRLPQVGLHVDLHVLAADVALRRQQHLDILRGGIEDGREVGGCHLRGVAVGAKRRGCVGQESVVREFRGISRPGVAKLIVRLTRAA